jgi:hypothetical protein
MMSIDPTTPIAVRQADQASMRSAQFKSRRKHGPGLLAATVLGAGVAAVIVSSLYDERSVGTRIDSAVATTKSGVQGQVDDLQVAASSAAQDTAKAANDVAATMADVGITAAVKTSLAADPALSALKIGVKTDRGVVRLDGPAPSEKARDRAQVLALAPSGVKQVDNKLVVTQRVAQPAPNARSSSEPAALSTVAPASEALPPVAAPVTPLEPVVPEKPAEPVTVKPVENQATAPQ